MGHVLVQGQHMSGRGPASSPIATERQLKSRGFGQLAPVAPPLQLAAAPTVGKGETLCPKILR